MELDRRTLLVLSGGVMMAAGARPALAQAMASRRRILVIGAGIIGASIAYHLAKSGAQVTVIEKEKPTAGATRNSFAWLNAGAKQPLPYHHLNLLGILGWHRLQAEIGLDKLPLVWGGNISWTAGAAQAERARASVLRQRAWGYPVRLIDAAELKVLLPTVVPGPADSIAFSEVDGTVDPVLATEVLLAAAQQHGATVRFPAEVTGFEQAAGRVSRVRTTIGDLEADNVVLAAGLACQPLAALLNANVPVGTSLGVLAHSVKRPLTLPRLAYTPTAHIKQNPDGSFVTYATRGTPADAQGSRDEGEALLREAAGYVPEIRDAKLDYVTLGRRVLPRDGLPIVGPLPAVPNVYVAAMHSGMTMGPAIGQLVAIELLDGAQTEPLQPFRPDRFI